MTAVWPPIPAPEQAALVAAANVAITTDSDHDWAITEVFDLALTRRNDLEGAS